MQRLVGGTFLMLAGCCIRGGVEAPTDIELWLMGAAAAVCAMIGDKIYHNYYMGGE